MTTARQDLPAARDATRGAGRELRHAHRGFIATIPHAEILDPKGRVVWSMRH